MKKGLFYKFSLAIFLIFAAAVIYQLFPVNAQDSGSPDIGEKPVNLSIEIKENIMSGVHYDMELKALDEDGNPIENYDKPVNLSLQNGKIYRKVLEDGAEVEKEITQVSGFKDGTLKLKKVYFRQTGKNIIKAESTDGAATKNIRVIPGILAILPPLLAIGLALAFKQVIISLFCGIWLGAVFVYDYNPFTAFLRTMDTYIIRAIAYPDHVSIIVFSLFLGGMVAIIGKSGGSQGMVNIIARRAKTARSGQIATWLMGLFIFFDDYANTLIVGNSMRPLTDKLRISREKLSFIVDATAAPVTNIAIISTWIGFEIGVIGDNLKDIGPDVLARLGVSGDAYIVFVQTIPFRFYPVLAILFVFLVGFMLRDFGPMFHAEKRAAETGQVLSPTARPLSTLDTSSIEVHESIPKRWYNAVVPIVSVIVFTLVGLWFSGREALIEKHGRAYLKGDPKLTTGNVMDTNMILTGLKEKSRPGTMRLWGCLDPDSKRLINEWEFGNELDKKSLNTLIAGLNGVLKKKDFYDASDFTRLKIPLRGQRLMNKGLNNLSEIETKRLNRILLESIFPLEIKKMKPVKIYEILGAANSLQALIWASLLGSLVAIGMVLGQRIMDVDQSIACWIEGTKSIVPAIIILTLAWGIGDICKSLDTAGFLSLLASGRIAPQLLPFLIFVLSAVTAFATGTSWGTMSIIMPIAIHIGYSLPPDTMGNAMKGSILLGSIAGVLAGATFGDHCSPISDTTIMSSMASGADHIDHVRTQAPYALTVAAVGALLGSIPSGYGLNPWLSMILCTAVLFLILKVFGKNPWKNVNKNGVYEEREEQVEDQVE